MFEPLNLFEFQNYPKVVVLQNIVSRRYLGRLNLIRINILNGTSFLSSAFEFR